MTLVKLFNGINRFVGLKQHQFKFFLKLLCINIYVLRQLKQPLFPAHLGAVTPSPSNSEFPSRATANPWSGQQDPFISESPVATYPVPPLSSEGAFSAIYRRPKTKQQPCRFCLKKGEDLSFCYGHRLHDEVTGNVACPVLRRLACKLCGATGNFAHTRKYCPKFAECKDEFEENLDEEEASG